MPPKPKLHNWNDVQIMLATISIAATLGLWNVFAEPVKTVTAQVQDQPVTPPTPEPFSPVAGEPTAIPQTQPQVQPQAKIMFTQVAPQTSNVVQPQKKKKKNNSNNNGGGGGGTVTNTKTS